MKHVIIGTAGHVDHGKTLLIKALTGIDTDRLQEEKKRGITIELGFAHLDWPDGTQAGIVDVPGHEKFIRNMLSGAGGIDLAMLVVAADEGFMPQTVEHMNILILLGIKDGLTVITKSDTVEEEWLEMMQEEIKEREKGSFLEGKPILTVSAYTGQGISRLKEKLYELVQKAGEKSSRIPFRLPIDRVFSVDGFGTVVTGTLIEGCIHEGESAQLVPSGAQTRIRNLQVHGEDVNTAYAGQRVAVNLGGLKKSEVEKGETVIRPGSVRISRMLDVKLTNLRDSKRIITNDMQVHLFHGSTAQLCKVVLLNKDRLEPGESGYAQLRMSENIACKNGDRFVIRFYSPLETIGGGVVLDDCPIKHKRNVPAVIEALQIRESGSHGDRVYQLLKEQGIVLPTAQQLQARAQMDIETLQQELLDMQAVGRVMEPLPQRYIAEDALEQVSREAKTILEGYHKQNPLHSGMKIAEFRQKLFKKTEQAVADALMQQLQQEGLLRKEGERMALGSFSIHYTKRQNGIRTKLLNLFEKAGIEPDSLDEIMAAFPVNEKADCKQVLDSLLSSGELVLLSPQICYHKTAYEKVLSATKAHFADHETITLAELRDLLATSRKYALAILEFFDRCYYTRKEGDYRKLLRGFPKE